MKHFFEQDFARLFNILGLELVVLVPLQVSDVTEFRNKIRGDFEI